MCQFLLRVELVHVDVRGRLPRAARRHDGPRREQRAGEDAGEAVRGMRRSGHGQWRHVACCRAFGSQHR